MHILKIYDRVIFRLRKKELIFQGLVLDDAERVGIKSIMENKERKKRQQVR